MGVKYISDRKVVGRDYRECVLKKKEWRCQYDGEIGVQGIQKDGG